VHRDISTGNIIVVEDNGCIRGFLSDFEYAKAMSNQSSSSDPKTICFDVKDRCCLIFYQGTPYFMPLDIHRGRRYADEYTKTPLSVEEEMQILRLPLSVPRIAILRYNYHHDHESLMWIALYIVFGLVYWEAAQETWPKIFTNSLYPSPDREYFFKTPDSSLDHFRGAFHSDLGDSFPRSFELIRKSLLNICTQSKPEDKDYHGLFNYLILAFDELLAVVDKKPNIVCFVERSGQANVEVEEPRKKKKTEHTPHPMNTRKCKELSDGKVSGGESLDKEGSEPLRMRL